MTNRKLHVLLVALSLFCFSRAAHADVGGPFSQWILLSTESSPPSARRAMSSAFDAQTGSLFVFGGTNGGCGSACDFNDVWFLPFGPDPDWIELETAGTPPAPRTGASAAFDSSNSQLIVFGGGEGSSSPCANDTWVLSNANIINDGVATWSQLNPLGGSPAARIFHTAVYDPGSNRMIVFGGNNCLTSGAQYYNDIWVLSNANGLSGTPAWIQLTVTGSVPAARENHTAVYDSASNRMIIFGGANGSGQLNDVWVLSNANGVSGTPAWTQLSPAGVAPSPRGGSTATYDPVTNRMTIFGGNNPGTTFNDVWVLSNANGVSGIPSWTQIQPSSTLPSARSEQSAAFNPYTNQMVIFGGGDSGGPFNDAWVLTNASGALVITSTTLPTGHLQLPYSANPMAYSGTTPYAWAVVSGSLPPGLTLNSSTGAITGTPTATGSFSFVLQVIDNSPTPQLINQNFTLTVAGPVAPNFQRYTIPTSDSLPSAIGAGPDGAMWFAESQGNKIGRISLSGTITEYAIPTADSYPLGIAAGPDGALWFSESDGNNIGRITTTGVISEFPVGSSDPPAGITLGPDGALWFAESESYTFGRIGTSGTVEQFGLPESEFFYNVANTVAGPDGTLWFTDAGNDEIGQMTPSGEVTEFPIPTPNSSPSGIAAGPDGALWFTESDPVANKIGRITTTGVITEYPIPTANSSPTGIVVGPDGALWFTETNANSIGRITTSGVITEFAIPGASGPIAIALGSDGALWFTTNANTVGRLSLVGALGLTCDFSAQARANAVYSANCTASNGANPYTYSITAGTLPPGLSLNASTGAITGTPASVGVFSFTVQATDNSSPTQTATYATSSFVVLPPVLVLTCTAPSSAQAETAYSGSCAASGGTPPYTFSVGSGTLPPGLSFSATGTLVGTPRRSGTYSFSLQVTDSESPVQLAAQSLSITVAPPPLRIATAAAPNGTVGLAYSLTLLARHGAAPYTWAITSGSLPAGLSLNTTAGTITGVSRTAGSSTFTIKVADSSSSSQAVSQAFTISIIAGLTITTTALPNGTSGIPYSASVAAQSGTAPYTWSIAAGALPSGLTLNAATGIITGTPTASGSFPFTLKVTDSSTPSLASTQPLSIYITPPIAEPVRPTFSLCASSTESSVCAPLPAAQPPAKAINVTTQLNEPTSVAISGTLTLTFAPNAADLPAGYMDPALQFVDPTGKQLGTTYIFTVPPMATSVSLPDIQPGTVAGAITVTMIVGGQESAASTITVEPLAPVIESNSVQILNITANGFDVELIANSTPRDMTTATLTFAAASGTQIIGNATFSIDISSALAQWYSSTQGQSYGSQFALTIPFTFSGNMSALQSVTATLTNSIGTSSSITGSQ